MNQKNKLLFAACITLLIIAFPLAFQKTVHAGWQYATLKKELKIKNNKMGLENQIIEQAASIDEHIQGFAIGLDDFESLLLATLNTQCDSLGIRIISLKEPWETQTDNVVNYHFEIIIQGAFESTLHLIRNLEFLLPQSEIIHLEIQKTKNTITRKKLKTQLILVYRI